MASSRQEAFRPTWATGPQAPRYTRAPGSFCRPTRRTPIHIRSGQDQAPPALADRSSQNQPDAIGGLPRRRPVMERRPAEAQVNTTRCPTATEPEGDSVPVVPVGLKVHASGSRGGFEGELGQGEVDRVLAVGHFYVLERAAYVADGGTGSAIFGYFDHGEDKAVG